MCNVQYITVREFATNQKILSVYDFILTLKVTEIFFCTFVATATIVIKKTNFPWNLVRRLWSLNYFTHLLFCLARCWKFRLHIDKDGRSVYMELQLYRSREQNFFSFFQYDEARSEHLYFAKNEKVKNGNMFHFQLFFEEIPSLTWRKSEIGNRKKKNDVYCVRCLSCFHGNRKTWMSKSGFPLITPLSCWIKL